VEHLFYALQPAALQSPQTILMMIQCFYSVFSVYVQCFY